MTSPALAGVLIHTTAEQHPAMRAFYVDVVGLHPRSDRPGFVNFEFGQQRLTISVHDGLDGRAEDPVRIMLNFATSDADAMHAAAVAAGATSIRTPSSEPWGGIVATVTDPDGNYIQFMELPNP